MARSSLSAICVTHPSRWGLVQRSILNFCEQTFADRELVIVVSVESYASAILKFVESISSSAKLPSIKVRQCGFRTPTEAFLHGLGWATGEWIAVWDDDNFRCDGSLDWQVGQSLTTKPSVLADSLYYFLGDNQVYVTDYYQPAGAKASERCAAASMIFHRDAYPAVESGSPGPWAVQVLDRTRRLQYYDVLRGNPWMFMVGVNGDNWRGDSVHYRMGTTLTRTWTREQLLQSSDLLDSALARYHFQTPMVHVCGKDGAACSVAGLPVWSGLSPVLPPDQWKQRIPGPAWKREMQQEQAKLKAKKAKKDDSHG